MKHCPKSPLRNRLDCTSLPTNVLNLDKPGTSPIYSTFAPGSNKNDSVSFVNEREKSYCFLLLGVKCFGDENSNANVMLQSNHLQREIFLHKVNIPFIFQEAVECFKLVSFVSVMATVSYLRLSEAPNRSWQLYRGSTCDFYSVPALPCWSSMMKVL